jgi:1-acyl-sn-glycerol-3-phosphate acyltransferase
MFLYLNFNENVLKKNIFGQTILLKRLIIGLVGLFTHRTFRSKKFLIKGSKNLINLPDSNVLFISNHQTYFYDVIAMLHVFNSSVKGKVDSVKKPKYLISPKTNLYYIASLETMKKSLITKLLTYAGAVLVQRSWRESGVTVSRDIRLEDPDNIKLALDDGWVITFPRGTTDNSKPIRKGTAHLIKNNLPLVVPVKISGFNKVFQRSGLKVINRNKEFSLEIMKPLSKNIYKRSIEEIIIELENVIS